MELNLKEKYKSLEPFTIELPALTVLTGLNGAGKTQILTAANENHLQITEEGVELNPQKYEKFLSKYKKMLVNSQCA